MTPYSTTTVFLVDVKDQSRVFLSTEVIPMNFYFYCRWLSHLIFSTSSLLIKKEKGVQPLSRNEPFVCRSCVLLMLPSKRVAILFMNKFISKLHHISCGSFLTSTFPSMTRRPSIKHRTIIHANSVQIS